MSQAARLRSELVFGLGLVFVALASCRTDRSGPEHPAASADAAAPAEHGSAAAATGVVERGRYLTTILACGDCHTPLVMGPEGPVPDTTMLLAGHPQTLVMPPPPAADGPWVWHGAGTNTAFAGPWGVSYATNITPDEDTGIGSWTEEIFVNALRSGRHWGQSRPILPPMPWPAYARMTDEDLKAVYAYLRTVPAISNRAPEAVVAPPPTAPPPAGR